MEQETDNRVVTHHSVVEILDRIILRIYSDTIEVFIDQHKVGDISHDDFKGISYIIEGQ
jgi:hypothetical protein